MSILCPKCDSENPSSARFCNNCSGPLTPIEETRVYSKEDVQEPESKLSVGSVVGNKFKVLAELGGGGMGIVYKAVDTKLKRSVALKFLPSKLTRDKEYTQRFMQEAQAASSLDHPNICTIFEINETHDREIFIAMAYYAGETLKRKIKQGHLPVIEAVNYGIQIAQGLEKAHSGGIVHRDIKPANVMVTEENFIKILDFGLAKLTGQTGLYDDSKILGTAAYMSPEQARGEEVDHRTDLWSLGVLLYEALTGQLPFKGENAQTYIFSILNNLPEPITELRSEIPEELERIIYKCLRKKLDNRYQSAQMLLSHLQKLRSVLEKEAQESIIKREERAKIEKEAERRHVTVLCIEITGYAELLEGMDPEEVASLMSRCFQLFVSIEAKYGVRVDKPSENSFTIFFGVPKAVEDSPKKAINVAIEIRNKIHQFNMMENLPIPLDVRIGINTGIVIFGAMEDAEKKDYPIIGEAVNVASQLKDITAMGRIYVGPLTHKYTHEEYKYKPLKTITFKGKPGPVPVFELLSEKERIHRTGLGMDREIHSDMVGREKDLNKLHLHLIKVINGEGSIVNIIGEAGIGKSRLILEMMNKDEIAKINLFKGRALSIGKNLSFHPIIDILKGWIGIEEKDNSEEAVQKLERAIRRVYPEGADEIYPFISTLMGMKMAGEHAKRLKGIEGEALEKLILKSLRELIERIAQEKPLVIIFEDLHWADQTSVKFLESLYRLADNNPILFINVFRPDYRDTSKRILRTVKSRYTEFCEEILLESLDENQSEILISNLLRIEGLSPSIKDIVIKKTGGNPFFIEEVMRSFIDDGVVEITDGKFRITKKVDSVIVPDTINEVLMARIDKLDEATKSLLKIASVIGRNFFYKILINVAETVDEVDERLDYLKDIQLVLKRERMREIEYLFKHALAQEAAYESILLKNRKKLHLKIANSIESIFSDRIHEFYGMLALHYSKGEDLDKAEEYLIKAGEEALKSSASSEALHYYRDALHIYLRKYGDEADPDKIAMFEKNIALALFNRGLYVEANEYFERVLTYRGEKFPNRFIPKMAKFVYGLFIYLLRIYFPVFNRNKAPTERDNETINLYYKKNTALILIDPEKMFVEIFYWLKRLINFDLNKVENGVGIVSMSGAAFSYGGISFKFSKKILDFVKDKVDKSDVKSLLYYKVPEVLHNTFSGDWENIGEYDENLVNQNVRIGELFYTAGYALTHGYANIARGDLKSSQEIAKKLYEIADVYENEYSRASFFWYQTQLYVKFRKLEKAHDISDKGIKFANKTGFLPYLFSTYAFKARVYLMQGEIDKAEEILEYLKKIKPDINLVPYFLCTYYLSQIIYNTHKLEKALADGNRPNITLYRKQTLKAARVAIKTARKSAADLTESLKLMGTFFWILGKQRTALRWWEKSIKEGERLGARLELSRTFWEVSRRLSEENSRFSNLGGISGEQYKDRARSMFREMNLEWDLKKFDG